MKSNPLKILHLHEKTQIHGGAEVYISQLQQLLPQYECITYWVGIQDSEGQFIISISGTDHNERVADIKAVLNFIDRFIAEHRIQLINIHNIFNINIVRHCLKILPVVKSVHSPVMVCPGRDKFWRFSEEPCTIKYGLHCFYHIYKEGCSNRHPKRVKKAWDYVQFEAKEAAYKYKKIIVMSDYMRDGLLECGVPESQIIVNPYFTPIVNEESVNSNIIIKRLLFVGRLVSSKGAHIMISSLAGLLKESPNVYLDIIGDGLMKEELVAQVEKLGLQDKIIFHGWKAQPDIDKMIRQAYLVLFPSVYPEAFGIVGIEAMMRSKPVIAFNVGGVGTWLKSGINGFLVDNKDEIDFCNKVRILLEDEVLYRTISISNRHAAVSNFSPQVHINKLITVYNQ